MVVFVFVYYLAADVVEGVVDVLTINPHFCLKENRNREV
jgi:hypothetical protein